MAQERATKVRTRRATSSVETAGSLATTPVTAERSGQKTNGSSKSKGGKGKKGKGKGKGKLNGVEDSNWQEGWSEAGTKQGEKQSEGWRNEEHADGWWKDEQTGSSPSAGWWTANDQTPWEPEGPVGAIEVNSVEPRYIKHDRW